jgi:hypothetical protein
MPAWVSSAEMSSAPTKEAGVKRTSPLAFYAAGSQQPKRSLHNHFCLAAIAGGAIASQVLFNLLAIG